MSNYEVMKQKFIPAENISEIELSSQNKESFSLMISVGQPNPFYLNVISIGDILCFACLFYHYMSTLHFIDNKRSTDSSVVSSVMPVIWM